MPANRKHLEMDRTEELIEVIKGYPILYDTSHPDYKDLRAKNRIWDSVAEILQEKDGDIVKYRWKNLRDSYSKYLRSASGEENKYIDRYKYWPWAKQLSFIKPSIEMQSTRISRGINKLKRSEKLDTTVTIKSEESNSTEITEDPIYVESVNRIDVSDARIDVDVPPYCLNDSGRNDVNCGANVSSNISALVDNETDLIFLGYSKLIQKMDKRQQAAVKYNIAKVIMNAELEDAGPAPKKKPKITYEFEPENEDDD